MEEKTKNSNTIKKKTSKKKKIIKRIIWGFTIFIALLFLSAGIIAYVFEDKIADIVLKELYKSMKTEIKHKNVSFSLIRKFPMASLKIDELQVQGFNEKRDMLSASSVYLHFNFLDLIRTDYKVKRIEIKKAELRLKVFKDGVANWDFFSIEDSSDKDFVVNLNSIVLKNVNVSYESLEDDIELGVSVSTLTAKGDFAKKTFDMQITTDLTVDSLKVASDFAVYDKNLIINTDMLIDNENYHYQFKHLKAQLNRLNFNVDIDLQKKIQDWHYSINLNGKELNIKDILKHTPDYVNEAIKGYELGGLLQINLTIKGQTGKKKKIDIRSKYSIKKGTIHNIANNIGLINVRLQGNFHTTGFQLLQTTTLQVSDLKAILNKKNISANLYIKNLQRPFVRLHLESDVNLEDWQDFMPKSYVYEAKGNAEININFENQLKSFSTISTADFEKATMSGTLILSDVYLQLVQGETAIEEINGKVELNNQVLYLDDVNGKINKNNFIINGKINHFFDYIFDNQKPMHIIADVSSPYLNMNTFLARKETTSSKKSDSEFELVFPANINFNIKLSVNQFVFDKFEAVNVSGNASLKDNTFTVNNLNLKSFGGNMIASGYAEKQSNKTFLVYCSAKLNNVDVRKMFYSFNNFGQSDNGLTDKNIRGTASTTILFKAYIKDNLDILLESVDALSNITITDGQLLNFKPLASLSKFVDLEDLYNIRFATLSNRIQIKNQVITIPEMDIKNNALNLTVSGYQWFNGDLDYYIKIKMNELLSKKFQTKRKNKKEEDFGEIIDDNTGNTYVHLTATGNLDNPRFKWSRKEAKKEVKEQIKSQKEDLKTIFQSESRKIKETKQEDKKLNDDTKKTLDIEVDENW